MKYFFIGLIFLSVLSSCTTQKIVTAPDKPIVLATKDMKKCVKVAQKRDWYFLWGLLPVSEKEPVTASLLTGVNKPVKIEVTTTFTDAIITMFTFWGSFVPETVIVYECSK